MNAASRVLRLAVPNKGRLRDTTSTLLRDAGLVFEQTDRALSVRVRNVELDLLFVRTEDIVEFLVDDVADLGITGYDLLAESGKELPIITELGYGRCSLTVAVPNASDIDKVEDFEGLRIATSHPNLTERFFADRGIGVTTVPLRGSVEVAPKLGVAEGIADLVSTGSTMLINGLRPVVTITNSQAVLVGGPTASNHRSAELDHVAMALTAVVAGRRRRYVVLNAPRESVERIGDIIPGMESPTVVPLAEDGMVAIHSVVDADEVWNLLPDLRAAGGRDILVLRIEQLIS